jgi:hypothetical protein
VTFRAYVRLARKSGDWRGKSYVVDAAAEPNPRPLTQGSIPYQRQLHTIHFALDINVPDELLKPADWPTVTVNLEDAEQIPIEVEPVAEEVAT